jgi:methyl-accepting chemotaxis protein
MSEVLDSVKRVTMIIAEIMNASDEQATGIEQINQALTQMDQVTQQNAALVEEAAAAAQSMREQTAALVKAVGVFRVNRENAWVAMTPAAKRIDGPIRGEAAPGVPMIEHEPQAA